MRGGSDDALHDDSLQRALQGSVHQPADGHAERGFGLPQLLVRFRIFLFFLGIDLAFHSRARRHLTDQNLCACVRPCVRACGIAAQEIEEQPSQRYPAGGVVASGHGAAVSVSLHRSVHLPGRGWRGGQRLSLHVSVCCACPCDRSLGSNRLTGQIPRLWGDMPNLQSLQVSL